MSCQCVHQHIGAVVTYASETVSSQHLLPGSIVGEDHHQHTWKTSCRSDRRPVAVVLLILDESSCIRVDPLLLLTRGEPSEAVASSSTRTRPSETFTSKPHQCLQHILYARNPVFAMAVGVTSGLHSHALRECVVRSTMLRQNMVFEDPCEPIFMFYWVYRKRDTL